jgi:hypothetical protein
MSEQTNTRTSGTALCLSAAVLAGLIVAQGAGLFDSRASADMAISSAGVTMMTTRSGNTEPLFVVDDRTETLFVYKHERGRLELWSKHSLPELFARARSGASGAP